MGNNSSSSSPVPKESLPPPVIAPPVPSDVTPPASSTSPQAKLVQEVLSHTAQDAYHANNPGTYEELHKKCKEIFPQVFEGGKLTFGKGLTSHFQINHNLVLSSPMMSGYRFGATYVGTKQLGPQESYPILLGDMDASGNLNANIIHGWTRSLLTRVVAQFSGEKMNTQFVTDYKGSSYTASCTVGNPDFIGGTGLLVSQYLQRITSSIDLGAECMYQRSPQIPGGQIAIMSLAGRIHGEKWQLSSTFCPNSPSGPGFHSSYHHKINDELQIGAEIEGSLGMGEFCTSVGYQYDIPNAGVVFKGQFDTNWNIQATMEKKLEAPVPFTFLLSGFGNQAKSDYKFGIGLMVG